MTTGLWTLLATVVIGGLMTATLLTLFVLPVVYGYFGKASKTGLNQDADKRSSEEVPHGA